MRSFLYWTLLIMLIVWTGFTGYSFFGKATIATSGLSLVSFAISWAVVGIPLSLLILIFKPR